MLHPHWFIALPARLHLALPAPPAGLTLLHPDDHHATIAFFGAIDEARADAAFASVCELLRATPHREREPFTSIRLGAVVPMGRPDRASALAIELHDPSDRLEPSMRRQRDRALDAAALPREERPLRPHVTIARVARDATTSARRDALAWADAISLEATTRLDAVALYATALDRRERRYRITRSISLDAPLGSSAPSGGRDPK